MGRWKERPSVLNENIAIRQTVIDSVHVCTGGVRAAGQGGSSQKPPQDPCYPPGEASSLRKDKQTITEPSACAEGLKMY